MRVAVLRPAPDNARTAARLSERGHDVTLLPLFETRALPWAAPDPDSFDALLLTSANAVRLASPELERLKTLPVIVVGPRTAAAAHDAGFSIAITGDADAARIAEQARAGGYHHMLHLAGRDHVAVPDTTTIVVYASEALSIPPGATLALEGQIVLLHSQRAAERLATLVERDRAVRAQIAVAALSPAIQAAAGPGWRWSAASATPDDAALVALVHAHVIDHAKAADDKAP